MELSCKVQNYEWGKKGAQSTVAKLKKSANSEFTIEESLNYAELWMGTHVNAPSVIKSTNENLSQFICNHPEYLGENVLKHFQELPFLFKVLSVDKALSIQAHPSKKHAEELHKEFPSIYKDSNHKPEMAIALTPFEALCGFRPWPEIKKYLKTIPELQHIVCKNEAAPNDLELIKFAFKEILICPRERIIEIVDSLLKRFSESDQVEREFLCADLVERLHSQFPYDNGILMVYFLNYLKLKPTEAIFLGANEPHAYLSGDCVECMACSDNVVRAGLTPKFVDINTLCSMLIYDGSPPEAKLFSPEQEDCFSSIFKPPVPDFALIQIKVPKTNNPFSLRQRNSASILLIIYGKAEYEKGQILSGTVLFIPSKEVVTFLNISEDLLIYQAIANV